MKISEIAVRRGVATAMVFALVVLLGSVAITKLPLEFMPKMDAPFVEIHAPYEGVSPVEICEDIAEPIEEALATLPGIDEVKSRCMQGYAYIMVELSGTSKMDYLILDIQERIDSIRNELPSDLMDLFIMKFDTEQIPVIAGAVTFPGDKPENNELLDRYVVRPLKTVEGVADVQIQGLEEKRVLVEIDQNKLVSYGVNVLQVYEALAAADVTISAGEVEHAGLDHAVRIVGEFKSLEEIRDMPVTRHLTISDLATVKYDYEELGFIGRINKKRAYILTLLKESNANTVDVSRRARARLDEILSHPRIKGAEFKIWFDQAQEITTSIDILRDTGVVGAVLAFLVLWVFLKNIRSTLVVASAIPMSLLTTIACMYFLGLTFNVITLSALIVGIGMLVDNSIVVLEAVDLKHRQGEKPENAAVLGASEVGLAISVATTTTVIVFLPLIFTERSQTAVLMKQMGIVLALSIGSSLVVSLTLIPLLASRILTPVPQGLPRWYQRLSGTFLGLLDRGLDHRGRAVLVVGTAFLVSMQVFLWPFPWEKMLEKYQFKTLIEKEAIPEALKHMIRINVRFERRPPIEEIEEKVKKLEDMFLDKKDEWGLDTVASIVSDRFARVLLVLPNQRTTKYTASEIRNMASDFLAKNVNWPGVKLDTSGFGHGPHGGMGGSTSIKVRGPDPEQVYHFADTIRTRLKGVPGLREIKEIERTGEHELHVLVDRDQARTYGFRTDQVAMAVSYSIRGVPVGQFMTGDVPLDIYMQLKEADRKKVAHLEEMNVQNVDGSQVPLKNLASFKEVPVPEMVRRDNRQITVRIPIVPEGKDLGEVSRYIYKRMAGFKLPRGYSWVMSENFKERAEDLKVLGIAIGLAMVLVFLVMTAQFESFFLPFVIMFTLPFAMIGVVLALLVSRATFNILSGAGCLLLIGIVVNNAIVLVDHIHNLRKAGLSEKESLMQAASDRFRPIMMTALTTMVGILPMALGLNDTGRMMYSPLGIAVLGGLFISTFLTPFVIPVIYSLSDDLLWRVKGVWRMFEEV